MSTDENSENPGTAMDRNRLSRRAVVGTAAWSVPVITVASATPAFAGSGPVVLTKDDPAADFTATSRDTSRSLSAKLTGPGPGFVPLPGQTINFSISPSGWLSFSPTSNLTTTTAVTDGVGVATTTLYYSATTTSRPEPGAVHTVMATYLTESLTWQVTYLPNLVAVRVGTGAAALNADATTTFLEEYREDGTPVTGPGTLTLTLPIAAGGGNNPLTISGSANSEGALARSSDRRFVTVGGYAAVPGTAAVIASSAARVVGRVDAAGAVNTATALTDAHLASSIRSAVSSDGNTFWTGGTGSSAGNAGTRSASPVGATTSTQVSSTVTNMRVVNIFGSQLYVTTMSGAFIGVNRVGTGTPTTSGQTTTLMTPVVANQSPYGFVLLSVSGGAFVLFTADDASAANGGGIRKFSSPDGSAWTYRNTYRPGAGTRSVTGYVTASGDFQLFATTDAASNNTLVSVIDTADYNVDIAATHTTLVAATTNRAFRGVTFAPDA